ncbi:UDP-N-acetylglucosamine transporter-like isoform X1 [Macrosteles quadrilineatus]|uniref:UDP-N-acetylglucosamine transporter-like isoform X1 n=1 Tax=Macrosteles quadrilineatus TaxID=74068 RepID=UPI0023E15E2E|nr:UDP-N-acetylglucosamine transporter-like isoform X1 [Macrosteles quadrilineatus]XP_054280115.1 UDP-N-acetylglucosamine transporter-like isoform X1 [Macrosteles quadrilineatus]
MSSKLLRTNQRKVRMLKVVSLVTLTLQNAVLGLSMRYACTRTGDKFLSSTAVFMAELVKLVTSLALVYKEEGSSKRWIATLHNNIVNQPMDTLKVCVPSLLYIIQNNLLYLSASHLDAATYQVTYQLKILTTAMFAVTMLKRTLLAQQWAALVLLALGVAMVQLTGASDTAVNNAEQNRLIGFAAAIGACVLSGFAGIYFEMILKGSDISVWMRNVQLSFLSLPFGLLTCFAKDMSAIRNNGFFHGYDWFIAYLVVLQAGGGLMVAMVVKYADNILKGFATSLAIVISCIVSVYLFDFMITFQFVLGAAMVIASVFLYSYSPKTKPTKSVMDSAKESLLKV